MRMFRFYTLTFLICSLVFVLLFACNKKNSKNGSGVSSENSAHKLIKALKDNDFETFKSLFISENELVADIKKLDIEEEQKKQILSNFQDHNAEVATTFLTKAAFDAFRADVEEKYGDKFWALIKILDHPEIINSVDEITKFSESEVNFKLLLDADTLQLPLKTFYEQKGGWKFSGIIKILNNNEDPNVEVDEEEEGGKMEDSDTTKGVNKFDPDFEGKAIEEEE